MFPRETTRYRTTVVRILITELWKRGMETTEMASLWAAVVFMMDWLGFSEYKQWAKKGF